MANLVVHAEACSNHTVLLALAAGTMRSENEQNNDTKKARSYRTS